MYPGSKRSRVTRPLKRRRVLQTLSLAGGVSLAGCNLFANDRASDGASTPDTDSTSTTDVRVTDTRTTPSGEFATAAPTDGTATAVATGESTTPDPTDESTTTAPSDGTATADPTDGSASAVSVSNVAVEPSTVRQGGTVTVRVTLDSTDGTAAPHTLRLSSDETVLRRRRLALGTSSTVESSFTVGCDEAGRRQFAADGQQASVTVEQYPQSFVEVEGTDFTLDGEPFPVVGTNNTYLHHKTRKTVDEVFRDAADVGLNTIRVLINGAGTDVGYCREFACGPSQYGLQPARREYDEPSFRRLDYVVATAKRHGIRLIPSLITLGPGGMEAYVNWVDGAETLDDFYTNSECRAIYRDYLEHVLTRENTITGLAYREDPTILCWELANEPELSEGPPYGEPLQDWLAEMATHAKSIDPNHLVSAGLIGWNDADTEADYLACYEPDALDAASTHMYYDASGIDDWVARHAGGVHEQLGKPLYVGEFGWDATRTEDDYERQLANRHEGFRRWYDQFARHDVAGSLVWFLLGHLDDGSRYPDHDGFGIYAPEDGTTVEIIRNAAERFGTTGADR